MNSFRTYDVNGDVVWRNVKREIHQDNGEPAVISVKGQKEWWQHNIRHRIGGPAIISPYGIHLYYIKGLEYSYEDYCIKSLEFKLEELGL